MVAARVDRGHKGGEETLEASGRRRGKIVLKAGRRRERLALAWRNRVRRETGSGAGADPGDTPDGWRWTKLGDGGILKRQIPMDEAEDIQISYILTDLNVEVTDSEEILLEEEYVVPWEEIHQDQGVFWRRPGGDRQR